MADLPKPIKPTGPVGKAATPPVKTPGKTVPGAKAPAANAAKTDPKADPKVKKPAKKIDPLDLIDVVPNEAVALARHKRLLSALTIQAIVIGVVSIGMVIGLPFFQTRYNYYAMTPENEVTSLTPLFMPNLTDSAIEAWAANSVTEILTIGFGDYDRRLLSQKGRFTPDGWTDFVHTFFEKKIGDTLKKDQLVLTTVPSDVPEITAQSVNPKHVYEWNVTVPVIMTYATNNDVTRGQKSTVKLTIVRVPYDENNSGIAIDVWRQ